MKIKLAELVIDIGKVGEYTEKMCADYAVEPDTAADFAVSVNPATLERESKIYPNAPEGYIENICLYREICKKIVHHNAMLIHSAAVAVDGKAYLFSALSGTGKTTHVKLWLEKFGERALVINGDKPIIREKGGILTVYGTPWCGKEGINTNIGAPIEGICILKRGEENWIERISKIDALSELMGQTIKLDEPSATLKALDMLDKIIMNIPVYRLCCNMNPEAADVAYSGMCGK